MNSDADTSSHHADLPNKAMVYLTCNNNQETGNTTIANEVETLKGMEPMNGSIAVGDRQCKNLTFMDRIPAFGIICGILAAVANSTVGLLVKLVQPDLHGILILCYRSSIVCLLNGIVMLTERRSLLGIAGERWTSLIRSIIGTLGLFAYFQAVKMIHLPDVTTLQFSYPVFVCLLGCIFLKEKYDVIQILTLCVTIFGVVVIARPTFIFPPDGEEETGGSNQLIGTSLSVASAIAVAIALVMQRKLTQTPTSVLIMWYSLTIFGGSAATVTALGQWNYPQTWQDITYIVCIGICGTLYQLFLTLALKYEEAGLVALSGASGVVVSFVFQIVVLKKDIILTSILGAVLVCTCVLIIIVRKSMKETLAKYCTCLNCKSSYDVTKATKQMS